MGKKISDDVIKMIPILFKQYGIKKKVAEELNISVSTVSKYLTIYDGAPAPKENKQRVKITEEIVAQINELYKNYKNMSKVAKELGVSSSTVKKYLSEENLKIKQLENDDRDALWFYIYRLFGKHSDNKPVSDWNITQMQKFHSQGMPYRGQLLTLKYFYEIKKHSVEKSNNSIGIIPWIYDDARCYYEKQAKKVDDITSSIQKQLEKDRLEIKYNPSDYIGQKRKKKIIDLNSLESD